MHKSVADKLPGPAVMRRLLVALWISVASCGGDGSVTDPFVPDTPQPAGHRIVSIASAFTATCALVDTGAVACWGQNIVGEFGNGTVQPSDVPVPGAGGLRLSKLYGSSVNPTMCGLDAEARAFCWGSNQNGAAGNGTSAPALMASPVAGEHRFVEIAAGYHTCALDEAGHVYCWGSPLGGALGDGSIGSLEDVLTPQLAGTGQYTAITSGLQFTCALQASGAADCWGWGVGMGSGPADRSVSTPTPVSGGQRYSRISAGKEWVCALTLTGSPYCWGNAGTNYPTDFRASPEPVPTTLTFREIVAISGYGACALTAAGEAYCWWGRGKPLLVPGHRKWAGLGTGSYPAVGSAYAGYCGYTAGGAGFCWELG